MKSAISALVVLALCLTSTAAQAAAADIEKFPAKPVRLIVPFVAGIGTDLIARTVAAKMSERWSQHVVVDNRPGAAGSIGVEAMLNAPADGYTIGLISASHSVNSATNPKLGYDITRDVQGVSQMTSLNYVMYVHPSVPVKNVRELIAYAKANPNKLNFGSSGTGGLQHLAGELFKHMAGVEIVHVPYKGGAQVNTEVLAGNVQLGFGTLQSRRYYALGKLRPLGISARTRSKVAPEIPTIAEQGVPGYDVDQWYGIVASSKVSSGIVAKFSKAIAESVRSPEIAERWAADGTIPVGSTPEQFSDHIRSEVSKWRKLVKDMGLVLQ